MEKEIEKNTNEYKELLIQVDADFGNKQSELLERFKKA